MTPTPTATTKCMSSVVDHSGILQIGKACAGWLPSALRAWHGLQIHTANSTMDLTKDNRPSVQIDGVINVCVAQCLQNPEQHTSQRSSVVRERNLHFGEASFDFLSR